jgi:hypothetical protein
MPNIKKRKGLWKIIPGAGPGAQAQNENIDFVGDGLEAAANHAADVANPHNVTAAQTGATPASHASDTNNPHGVTLDQLGAGSAALLEAPATGDADAGEVVLGDDSRLSGGGGGGGDITGGSPQTEPATISYQAPQTGIKAFVRLRLDFLPSNDDQIGFTTQLDQFGQTPSKAPAQLVFTWKTVLGSPYVGTSAIAADIRIESTVAASVANVVAALNDSQFNNETITYSDTWTATNPSGAELRLEQDFETTIPNSKPCFSDITLTSNWFDFQGGSPSNAVDWNGGVNDIPEAINSVTIRDFLFELGSSGPTVYLDGNVKNGDHTPEVLGTITDPNGIIDQTAGITFGSVAVGTKTFRTITIPPTKNQGLTGTATVNWTWKNIPFSAQIQKT